MAFAHGFIWSLGPLQQRSLEQGIRQVCSGVRVSLVFVWSVRMCLLDGQSLLLHQPEPLERL